MTEEKCPNCGNSLDACECVSEEKMEGDMEAIQEAAEGVSEDEEQSEGDM